MNPTQATYPKTLNRMRGLVTDKSWWGREVRYSYASADERDENVQTDNFFRNLIKSIQNQLENVKYNLFSGWLNKIFKKNNFV